VARGDGEKRGDGESAATVKNAATAKARLLDGEARRGRATAGSVSVGPGVGGPSGGERLFGEKCGGRRPDSAEPRAVRFGADARVRYSAGEGGALASAGAPGRGSGLPFHHALRRCTEKGRE
jgi:hypothetical protein